MKASTLFSSAFGFFAIPFMAVCVIMASGPTQAQDIGYTGVPQVFSREELAQMLAPVALYPDALLAQVLMASTYPAEVVEAERWLNRNRGRQGAALDTALADIDWDPSVKSLCHFPSILALMSQRISETTALGNAFLSQEADVMAMVQELRANAYTRNSLVSDARQTVIVEEETIIIVPADPTVVYVSYYDPMVVYGPWGYPSHPPHYWGPPGVRPGGFVSYWPASHFAVAFGTWSYFDWHSRYIHINPDHRPHYVRHDRWVGAPGRWYHAPGHRRGVVYHDEHTARKYSPSPYHPEPYPGNSPGSPQHRSPDYTPHGDNRHGHDATVTDRHRREQEQIERDRREREQADRQRREMERTQQDMQERERARREQLDRNRQQLERVERDRREQERADRHRREQEQSQQDRRMREQADRDRREREQADRQRREMDRTQQNAQAQERARREQLDRNRQQLERVERDRREQERADRQRQERERPQKDMQERERAQKEQSERDRRERERAERLRQQKEQAEREQQQSRGTGSNRGEGRQSGDRDWSSGRHYTPRTP